MPGRWAIYRDIFFAGMLGLGFAAAGLLAGGRYEMAPVNGGVVARLDRFTGDVRVCRVALGRPCDWRAVPAP